MALNTEEKVMSDEELCAALRAGLAAYGARIRAMARRILGENSMFECDLRDLDPGPFLLACIDGKVAAARKHIDTRLEGLNAEDARAHDEIAMVVACRSGKVELFNLLVEHGFGVESIRAYRVAPLRHACAYGNFEIVKKMISMGLTLDDVRTYNNEPLREAASEGSIRIVNLLIEFGLGPDDLQAMDGDALSRATAHEFSLVAEALIRNGAKPTPESLRLIRKSRGDVPPSVTARWAGTRELAWAEGPDAYDRWIAARAPPAALDALDMS